MKVAIIHNQFTRSGGMESYLLALVRGFLDQGDAVHLHVYKVDQQLSSLFPVTMVQKRLSWLPRRWRKYFFIHYYNKTFDRRAFDLSLSLTRTGCPDIAICGGIHPASIQGRTRQLPWQRIHDRLETYFEDSMLGRVPHVVAHSQLLAKEINQYYHIDTNKVQVVYPPVDVERFQVANQDVVMQTRQRLEIHPDRLTLLFPSLGHKRKGLQELLIAFSRLSGDHCELLVAGQEPRRILPGNVRYIGYINNLAPVYAAVDYTILPSHYEPFGLVVVESLQCGTPVIVSSNVGAAELMTHDCGVVLEDNHPDTIAGVIRRLDRRNVAPDFVTRSGLTIGDHIEKLKELAGMKRGSEW